MKKIIKIISGILFFICISGLVFLIFEKKPDLSVFFEPKEVRDARNAYVPEEVEGHFEYYFQLLNEDEKRAYREMYRGIANREETFYLSIHDENDIVDTYFAVLADHPELFWAHNHKKTYTTTYVNTKYCSFTPEYLYTDEEVNEIKACLEQVYEEVCSKTAGCTNTYEIVKIVYEYLIDYIDYSYSEDDQNIAGALWKKKAVCAGYARAFQYLLERFKIDCIYVDGDSNESGEGHAWNIVKLNDKYYYVDVTNGDQQSFLQGNATQLEEHKTIVYDYLCPFPEEYESRYTPSDTFEIPKCEDRDMNFYVLNQGFFSQYAPVQIYEYCKMRIGYDAAVIRYKVDSQGDFERIIKEYEAGENIREIAQYYMGQHQITQMEYHYGFIEEFKTVYIMF